MERERNLDKIESSEDTADSGVVKQVRVFLASSASQSVKPDKPDIAAAEGIVASIVEDMPFAKRLLVDIVLNPLADTLMNVDPVRTLGASPPRLSRRRSLPGVRRYPTDQDQQTIQDAKEVPGYRGPGPQRQVKLLRRPRGRRCFALDVVVGYLRNELFCAMADKIHARAVRTLLAHHAATSG
ncbi:hypothetical protein [Prosthecobacter sp.]|uniref:hypothetical protein n=1 Tax=Prosthecobacter sp. TaxID=1965333 RepID=UPI0037847C37